MANTKNIDVTSTGIQPSNYEKGQDVVLWRHKGHVRYSNEDTLIIGQVLSVGTRYIHVLCGCNKLKFNKSDLRFEPSDYCTQYYSIFHSMEEAETAVQINTYRESLNEFFYRIYKDCNFTGSLLSDKEINTLYSLIFETPGVFADLIKKIDEATE